MVDAAQAITFLTGAGYPNVGPIPALPLTIESTGELVGLTVAAMILVNNAGDWGKTYGPLPNSSKSQAGTLSETSLASSRTSIS